MDVGKRIAIIGAGFSGTALAAMLARLTEQPLEITLYDKSGLFGAGEAYRTPYTWHILNVRACDMSAFEDQPTHFVDWLTPRKHHYPEINPQQPIAEQYLPRYVYHHYLKDLIQELQKNKFITLRCSTAEVTDIKSDNQKIKIITKDGEQQADQAVLALGNLLPPQFPFPVSGVQTIDNSWNYTAIEQIPKDAKVMIVGMGLSMIDTVLSLSQQKHQGTIYAISRHGLLPLPHAEAYTSVKQPLFAANNIRAYTKSLREASRQHMQEGGDWRTVINGIREHIPLLWQKASEVDKKRFIRHVLPYWNVHRHRVHRVLMNLLMDLKQQKHLQTMAGRVLKIENKQAYVHLRHQQAITTLPVDWVINCMGPGMDVRRSDSPLVQSLIRQGSVALDPLALGLAATPAGELYDANGCLSNFLYTLGPPAKGALWECVAVPEIRKQTLALAKILIGRRHEVTTEGTSSKTCTGT